jgi:hypothetical protein
MPQKKRVTYISAPSSIYEKEDFMQGWKMIFFVFIFFLTLSVNVNAVDCPEDSANHSWALCEGIFSSVEYRGCVRSDGTCVGAIDGFSENGIHYLSGECIDGKPEIYVDVQMECDGPTEYKIWDRKIGSPQAKEYGCKLPNGDNSGTVLTISNTRLVAESVYSPEGKLRERATWVGTCEKEQYYELDEDEKPFKTITYWGNGNIREEDNVYIENGVPYRTSISYDREGNTVEIKVTPIELPAREE